MKIILFYILEIKILAVLKKIKIKILVVNRFCPFHSQFSYDLSFVEFSNFTVKNLGLYVRILVPPYQILIVQVVSLPQGGVKRLTTKFYLKKNIPGHPSVNDFVSWDEDDTSFIVICMAANKIK